jgi:predicted CXXCH cytochrome family protein
MDIPSSKYGSVRKTGLMLCLLFFLAIPRLLGSVHPVALDAKTDGAKCLECHGEKAKAKTAEDPVHSALKGGCLSCHEVRVNRDVTRVKLAATTPLALCLGCHADKNAPNIKGKVHSPAARDCLRCHAPHSSENKNHLLKPTSGGTKEENLCLSCHSIGVEVPKGGSRHMALDMGCETCHVTHKTGDPTQREFAYHLTKDAPGLCLDCHDAKDEALAKAHQNQPFAKADCLQCHDPHQSAAPKLMQAFLHPPFADKSCDTCHAPAKDGKVVLTAQGVTSLCVMCHDEQAKKIQTAKVQHPGAQGDCTDCHNPHAGRSPGFPKPNAVAVCLACHSDQAELAKEAHLHQPAFQQGCAICHEPHGGENSHLLRTNNVNSLCLECHGPDAEGKKLETARLITIFDGKVELPEDYFNKVPRLPLKYGLGHPTEFHPVGDVLNPKTKGTIAMNCLTCHQPHAGKEADMLVKDQKNNMNFCRTCHINGLDLGDVRVGGE